MTVVEFGLGTDGQRHRLDIGHVGCHRLQQRPRRGDHDAQRRAEALVVGMGQAAQQHQPRADRVDPRRQPLVRQRLPRREHRDRLTEHAAQFGGQVVGFAPGGGDHEQRTGLRQRAGREHPGAGRADEGEIAGSVVGTTGDIRQRGIPQRQFDEPRDRGLNMGDPRCGHDASIVGNVDPKSLGAKVERSRNTRSRRELTLLVE